MQCFHVNFLPLSILEHLVPWSVTWMKKLLKNNFFMVMKTFYGYENFLWLWKRFMVTKTFYGYENILWLWKLFVVMKTFYGYFFGCFHWSSKCRMGMFQNAKLENSCFIYFIRLSFHKFKLARFINYALWLTYE